MSLRVQMVNEAQPLVEEYMRLEWMKNLGYTRNLGSLSVFKHECFVIIGSEFERLEKLNRKRQHGKNPG